ncbi:MAG: uracil phosphoribosyltransferase [Rhodothermales bacterium]
MTSRTYPLLTVVEHPLLQRDLTLLRDRSTTHGVFRQKMSDAAAMLAYEALRRLEVTPVPIETPLEPTTGYRLAREVTVVAILRAGLGMVDAFVRYVPEVRVGHLGMYRDEESRRPVPYYSNIPPGLESSEIFVVDPMLATGGSACEAIAHLKRAGGTRFTFVCLVAAPEGVEGLSETHPDVPIVAAVLDRALDERAFIRPGLGDAGDRTFGTL